jgi:hypothetical protein
MIEVTYGVQETSYAVQKVLRELSKCEKLSFDTECRGVYTKVERGEAKKALKGTLSPKATTLARMVAGNSGLSAPALVSVTHFIFGTSDSHSEVLVARSEDQEMYIWKWLLRYKGLLVVHNALFDLKLMYHRVRGFPSNYVDTQLMVRALTNNAETWKAKVGLKELMGHYYKPAWSLMDDYEPEDFRKESFLEYAAIDGAATFHLHDQIMGNWNPPVAE